MTTLTDIENDVKIAMRERDTKKTGVLRMLVNRIKMLAKNDGNRSVTDHDVLASIQKSIKEVNETRTIYLERGVDTSEQDYELSVLEAYLPAQMSDDELRSFIQTVITQDTSGKTGKAMMGPIMAALKINHAGNYDPSKASKIAGELIT